MPEPFANTSLTALTCDVLSEIDTSLVPAKFQRPDRFAKATHLAHEKGALLEHAFNVGGARPIVSVGRALARVRDMPVLQVLLGSSTPALIAEKWCRLEEFHHSNHRTHIDCKDDKRWICQRFSSRGATPSTPFNCLIFGLQTGLLRLYDCGAVIGRAEDLIDSGNEDARELIRPKSLNHWEICWRTRPPGSANDMSDCSDAPLLKRLRQLLAQDLGRVWRLETVAHSLEYSPRSLQRQLCKSGHSFSSVLRATRAAQASGLLRKTEWTLADIGYACGYADQAHFQRDFRRAVNMTPRTYRDLGAMHREKPDTDPPTGSRPGSDSPPHKGTVR